MKTLSFSTHYEITPYKAGDNRQLETALSIWNPTYHRWEPLGYMIRGDTLYLPKGVDPEYIRHNLHGLIWPGEEYREKYVKKLYKMTRDPRSKLQLDTIEFIVGIGRYTMTKHQNQIGINIKPGDGKTYCTVHGIIHTGRRAIIITHSTTIRTQWYNEFIQSTNVPESALVIVDGVGDMERIMEGKLYGDFYFINHQTFQSAERLKGPQFIIDFFNWIQTGIKVYDEAHYEFANILHLDMLSNIPKTYYLTATFRRTNVKENRIFGIAFAGVYRFNNSMSIENVSRKHVIYCPMEYDSDPTPDDVMAMFNKIGLFSSYDYMKYELDNTFAREKLQSTLERVFRMIGDNPGRVLVTNPRIESSEVIRDMIANIVPNKMVKTVHSRHSKDENIFNSTADIIVSTIKSNGTGTDIKGIRFLINLEPFSSTVTAEQLKGRLREYSSTDYTYFFDIVDIGVPKANEFLKKRLRFYKKDCAKIIRYHL